MANPHRLELIDLLAQGERTVEELAQQASLSMANTSQHLQTLRAARLVEARREGLYTYYRLATKMCSGCGKQYATWARAALPNWIG